jgi:hypothetical protein
VTGGIRRLGLRSRSNVEMHERQTTRAVESVETRGLRSSVDFLTAVSSCRNLHEYGDRTFNAVGVVGVLRSGIGCIRILGNQLRNHAGVQAATSGRACGT